MNGVDYSKNLAKEREYIKDSVNKATSAAEKRIEDLNKQHEDIQKKQRDNYIEDRAELEKSYGKNIDQLKEKTANVLASKGDNFQKDIEKQRAEFEAESITKRKDFDQRLKDIKTSYQKSFDSEKQTSNEIKENQKKGFERNVNDLKAKQHEQLGQYGDKLRDTNELIKDKYNRERQQLVRAQEGQVNDIYKAEATKRNDLTHRIRQDLTRTKEAHEGDQAHRNRYMEDRLSHMEKHYQDRYDSMSSEYSQRNAELSEAEKNQSIQTNRDHQAQMADVNRQFNTQLRALDNDRRRRDNDSDEFKEVVKKQHGLSQEAQQENRIKQLSSQIGQAKSKYQIRANEEQDKYRQSMETQSADAAAEMLKKENEVKHEKLVAVTEEREKAQHKVENYEKQNKTTKENLESLLAHEQAISKEKLENLKVNFNKSTQILEENLKQSLQEVTVSNRKDKAQFVKQANERHTKDMYELKREFSKAMDMTIQGYEQRLASYQRENQNLRMSMDQKISDIVNQTDKKLETQRVIFTEQRAAEANDLKIAMDQREHKLKTDTNSIIVNFQKKLDKMQIEHDSKIKLLTNDYENKLDQIKTIKVKDEAHLIANQKAETEKLKNAFEQEKANLISTYESQIAGIKSGYEERLAQMQNFKKLS